MRKFTKIVALAAIAGLVALPLQTHAWRGDPSGYNYGTQSIIDSNPLLRDLVMGREIYKISCGVCHNNPDSDAPQLGNAAPWTKRVPEFMAVLDEHARNGFLEMPARGGNRNLSHWELALAVNYLIKARVPPRMPVLSEVITRGRVVYHFNCATCHDRGRDGAPRIGDTKAWEKRTPEWLPLLVDHARDGFLRMPPRSPGEELTAEDLRAAIVYMLSWSRIYPSVKSTAVDAD